MAISRKLNELSVLAVATFVGRNEPVRLPCNILLSLSISPERPYVEVKTLSNPGLRLASSICDIMWLTTPLVPRRINCSPNQQYYEMLRAGILPVNLDIGIKNLDVDGEVVADAIARGTDRFLMEVLSRDRARSEHPTN